MSDELRVNFISKVSDFTRNRKQSFHGTIVFMFNLLTKNLTLEIISFIDVLKKAYQEKDYFTKSAFVQARKKIKPEVFTHLIDFMNDEFYTDNEDGVKLEFNQFRLLAMDGTTISLPNTE